MDRTRALLRYAGWTFGALVLVLAVAVAFTQTAWFKDWLRRYLVREAKQFINGELAIGGLAGDLFTGVEIGQVTLTQHGTPVLYVKDIGLDYSVLTLLTRGIVIDALRVNEPRLSLQRTTEGWNITSVLKRETGEADRSGPGTSVMIRHLGVSNGSIVIDDRTRPPGGVPPDAGQSVVLPARVTRIDLQASFAYQPVDLVVDLAHLSFRAHDPGLALNSASGRLALKDHRVQLDRLAIRTAESSVSVSGRIDNYPSPDRRLSLDVSSDRFSIPELSGIVPALAPVRLQPAFEIHARGPAHALEVNARVGSAAGAVQANGTLDLAASALGIRGTLEADTIDASRVMDGLPSTDITADLRADVRVAGPDQIDGRLELTSQKSRVLTHEVEALRATAIVKDGHAAVDAALRAYGASATSQGTVVLPRGSNTAMAADLRGRVTNVRLRRLPAALGIPRLNTNVSGTYRARYSPSMIDARVVFAGSTVEGAAIAPGTTAHLTSSGKALTYAARGAVRDLDVQRIASALGRPVQALGPAPAVLGGSFDVSGGGSTLKTAEATAAISLDPSQVLNGTVSDTHLTANLGGGAASFTVRARFDRLDTSTLTEDPRLHAQISGTVTGDGQIADVSAPLAGGWPTARIGLQLEPSTVDGLAVERAALDAAVDADLVRVERLEIDSPAGAVRAGGHVAHTNQGASDLRYELSGVNLAAIGPLAGLDETAGLFSVTGTLTGNRARYETTGDASVSLLRYGTTVQASEIGTHYEGTLPELDPSRAVLATDTRATLVRAAGRDIRDARARIGYNDGEVSFDTQVTAALDASAEAPSLQQFEAAGLARIAPATSDRPLDVDVHVNRMALRSGDVEWTTPEAARLRYAGDVITIENLALGRGEQRLSAEGTLTLTDRDSVSAQSAQGMRIEVANVDIAELDRLALGGRGLGGRLNATAEINGPTSRLAVRGDASVTQGAFRDFAYERLTAALDYAPGRATVKARLQQNREAWLTVDGTLPAGTPPPGTGETPLAVRVVSSPIDVGVLQGLTPVLRDAGGTLQVDVEATGSLTQPRLAGSFSVRDGRMALGQLGTQVTDLDALVKLEGNRVAIDTFRVVDADQHVLQVSGGLDVGDRLPLGGAGPASGTASGSASGPSGNGNVDVRVQATQFDVIDNELGDIDLDVDLRLAGTLAAPRVNGNIRVHEGRLEIDRILERLAAGSSGAPVHPDTIASTDFTALAAKRRAEAEAATERRTAAREAGAPAEASAPDEGAGTTSSLFDQASLDVGLEVPDNLVVRGDDVTIEGGGFAIGDVNVTLGGEIRATKSPGTRPVVVGAVQLIRGFYEFQGRRFDLRRDSQVTFRGPDPTNPALDVTGLRDISGVEARVRVHGTAKKPALELSSTPPLDQGDILALIIFNRPLNDLGQGERATLASRAGSLAGGLVAGPVAEALRDVLDVDLLEISPVTDENAGAEVTVGDQIGERVFVKVTQAVGSGDAREFTLEYRLADWVRLESSVSEGQLERSNVDSPEGSGIDLVFVYRY